MCERYIKNDMCSRLNNNVYYAAIITKLYFILIHKFIPTITRLPARLQRLYILYTIT